MANGKVHGVRRRAKGKNSSIIEENFPSLKNCCSKARLTIRLPILYEAKHHAGCSFAHCNMPQLEKGRKILANCANVQSLCVAPPKDATGMLKYGHLVSDCYPKPNGIFGPQFPPQKDLYDMAK